MKKNIFLTALFLLCISFGVNAQITSYPYVEDFESGDGGWVVDDPANVSWELGAPAAGIINSADSGTNAWVTNLTGEYASGENGAVVSPIFDFSTLSAPAIEFGIWWNAEFSWDGMVLQSSIDDGTTWVNVGAVGDPNNWFNDATIAGNPGGQQEGWTGRDSSGNGSGGWVIARHALEGLAGQSSVLLRFAFGSDGSVTDEGIAFDTINIFDVSCPEPFGLIADGVTASSADITWTPGGTETMWEVVVQPAGTGVPTGPGVLTATIPYVPTGLMPVTDYEVYIRSDCGGEFSSWAGPIAFRTGCTVFVPEYLEIFDTITPDCWEEADSGDPGTGPGDLGGSSWVEDGYLNNGFTGAYKINLWLAAKSDWLLSPQFDLTGGPFQVDFDFGIMTFGSQTTAGTLGSDDQVQLLISNDNGATWTSLASFDNTSVVPASGTQVVADLSAYSGQIVQFGIWATEGTVDDPEDNDVFVDNFRVRLIPTCPEPTGLTLDTFSDVEATVSWTPGGAETTWEVAVQPAGTGLPAGPGVSTTDNPYTITGLTAITDYEVWVRAECGLGDLSSWVGPLNFTTLNTPPPPPVGVSCASGSSSFIFTADFDGVDGWTGTLNGGDGTWEIPDDSVSGGTGPATAFSGDNFMNYEASGGTTATASAVTPAIDMTTAVDGAELSFYMHAFGADMGTLNVGVGTSATGPFTNEFTWTGDLQTSETDPWVPVGVNLDAYLGQVIYVEFSHTGTGDFEGDMSIDLVRVETCGSFCIAPSSIIASNTTQTTVDIDWTANSGESVWEYVVVPAGTGEPTGPGTSVTTTSVTETGLTGTTEYEIWVRADCGGGVFSLWAGPIPFFTAPENNDPCSATTAVVNTDDSCNLVTFGTLFQASASGVPTGSCPGDPDDDVWFEFVAESNIQIISFLNIVGGGFFSDINHAVYEGDCNSLTELYCSDAEASVTPALTIGNTYFIRVFTGGSDPEDITFDLCIRPGAGNVLVDQTTYTVEELVVDILIDSPCAQISNITFTTGTDFGEENGIGYFTNPDGGFPFDEGLLMTSGDASQAAGPNINFVSDGTAGWPGDPDLTTIAGDNTNNATIIQFDFVPLNNELSFDFLMASEEYDMGTFECDFSDVFAFLLTDSSGVTTNLAVVPGTNDPILVTNIHPDNGFCPAVNEEFFGEYIPDNLPPISFDGRTAVFTAFSPVNIGETYTIKLAIADARDSVFDSGVFLQAGSFDIGEVDLGGDITIVGGNALCADEPVILDTSAPNVDHVWYKDGFVIDGETASTLVVTEPGVYTTQIIFSPSCIIDDEILIEFLPLPIANTPDDLTACSTTAQSIFDLTVNDAVVLGAQNPADYTLTYHETQADADSDSNPITSPYTNTSNPQTIFVRVEDNITGCHATESFELSISSPTHTAESVDIIGCDDDNDGVVTFDLDAHDINVLGGQDPTQFIITYHTSEADAQAGAAPLTSPYVSSGETVWVRVETIGFADCYVTNSFELIIGAQPDTSFVLDDIVTCDDASGDNVEDFDLEMQTPVVLGSQDPSQISVTYHLTLADAQLGSNALNSPYSNISNPQTIYVRVENLDNGCSIFADFDLIISGPTPTANPNVVYAECDDDFDGITDFDLATQDANILDGQSASDFTVTYHETQADADAGTGAIDTSSLYSSASATIFVRVENNNAFDCFSTTTMELLVDPLPNTSFAADFDYEVCPNATVPIQIQATANNYDEGSVSISWTVDGTPIPGESSLTLPVLTAGFYEITVVNSFGCEQTVGQDVVELESCVIPQGISPNGDGRNDVFDLSSYNVSKLEIFNRNGTRVYYKENYTNEWFGLSEDGDELPVGTYFYTMEYDNGKRRSAWVYIQREN